VNADLRIASLHLHPRAAPVLAAWHADAFGPWLGGWTVAEALAELRTHGSPESVPFTLVAFEEDQPVGSISLLREDPPAPPADGPWLASFFVRPDRRGRGIGGRLHDALVEAARSAGEQRLFLWTPDADPWYVARGWSLHGRLAAFGVESRVLSLDLSFPAP
jgi:predicted N-acetyltransferase YhbS